jgi:hypothetical protein
MDAMGAAALISSIDANTAAVKAQTEVLAKPRSIVTENGKPTGIRVG